jgi:uncharacterized membrane protein YqjE
MFLGILGASILLVLAAGLIGWALAQGVAAIRLRHWREECERDAQLAETIERSMQ